MTYNLEKGQIVVDNQEDMYKMLSIIYILFVKRIDEIANGWLHVFCRCVFVIFDIIFARVCLNHVSNS